MIFTKQADNKGTVKEQEQEILVQRSF